MQAYMCKTCGDEFSLSSELHKHQRYHTISRAIKDCDEKENPWQARLRPRREQPFRLEWPEKDRIHSF